MLTLNLIRKYAGMPGLRKWVEELKQRNDYRDEQMDRGEEPPFFP